ncbi:MAG: hypothetical protein ACJA2K_001493 [Thalassolituus sp.]|jgi:hypothetical protein
MSFLEHKISPPVVGIFSAGIMWVIAHYLFQINPNKQDNKQDSHFKKNTVEFSRGI